ncbi:MAG: hypothetical protein HZA16_03875 [Nitrospirae bacterium]|nr:hypothetical protein [Nitrospirota bacterium]
MLTAVLISGVVLVFLVLVPKFSTGRILYAESFVPEHQVYRKLVNRDLRSIPVRVEITHRKLYRVRPLLWLKPIFELLPRSYEVAPDRDGRFLFWAYPFDVINIIVGEDKFRMTCTLRHRVNGFWPKYANFLLALSILFSPRLLHCECIEIPTTLGKTCGYADKLSVFPGEDVNLMISTKADAYSMEFIRVGEKLMKLQDMNDIPGTYQGIKTKFPSSMGCGWKPTMKFSVPEEARSGCYMIKLSGGDDDGSFVPIIVKPAKVEKQLAVIASTHTWHAYNSWGGQNFYINYTSFPSKYILSTQRPLDLYIRNCVEDTCGVTRDHLLVGERFVWSWLEREGLEYDLYSDTDLHSPDVFKEYLSKYRIIIISTHNEYWSYGMIEHLKEFIKNGGNVISLSGNTMYKEVTFPRDDLMVLDGAYFRHQGFNEETVLGVAHDLRGYITWAPYKVLASDHWVYDNTGVKNGDLIGGKGLNVSPREEPGASGWETDKIFPGSPKNLTLLARGMNSGDGGAEVILFQEPGGGSVFSVGSITFGGSLLVDDTMSRMIKNVIRKFSA